MSASLVTPIFFDIGITFSKVSWAGLILDVPLTIHFFLLCSFTT
jgi:hypothetical protein